MKSLILRPTSRSGKCLMAVLLASALILFSCSNDVVNPGNYNGQTVTTTVMGSVLSESGIPLAGVQVKAGGQTKTSGNSGQFIFEDVTVPEERCYVEAVLSGYFDASTSVIPGANSITQVQIRMMAKTDVQTINGSAGGTVTLSNGSSVLIQPNSLQLNGSAYTGIVNVTTRYLDPTSANFAFLMPGGDLLARRSDSSSAMLFSYGILTVELTSPSGDLITIAGGSSSTISVSIPPSLQSSAPSSIPLWYFNEDTGLWMEDGLAVKQGNVYAGNVTHFTNWNCDHPGDRALIKGRVLDCSSNPIVNVWLRMGQVFCGTDAQGYFQKYVPTGIQFDVRELQSQWLTIQPIQVGPFTNGQTYDMGNITINCPSQFAYITGRVVCNSLPVSAYITARSRSGNNWFNVSTANDGTFTMWVGTNLDIDLSIHRPAVSTSFNMITPAASITTDIGDVILCDNSTVVGDNGFIINGDGFINEIINYPTNILTWNSFSGQYTQISALSNDSTSAFHISFPGNQAGIFDNNNTQYPDVNMIVKVFGSQYTLANNSQFNVTIASYGAVGDYIIGTFSADLFKNITSVPVQVTGGKFKVLRTQ